MSDTGLLLKSLFLPIVMTILALFIHKVKVAESIAKGLEVNKTLKSLKVSCNWTKLPSSLMVLVKKDSSISEAGIETILRAMLANNTITDLQLTVPYTSFEFFPKK